MTGVYDVYADIIQRIKAQCPEFALVGSPSVVSSEDDVMTSLPGCYVMPGNSEPTENGNNVTLGLEDQEWLVLLVVGYPEAIDEMPEIALGEHALNVVKALNNWSPANNAHRIRYKKRSAVDYDEGYATLKLLFAHRKVVH